MKKTHDALFTWMWGSVFTVFLAFAILSGVLVLLIELLDMITRNG